MYFDAKFSDMTPNLAPNNPKGQSKKYHDTTNTLDQSNHSLYFVECQRSTPCQMLGEKSENPSHSLSNPIVDM